MYVCVCMYVRMQLQYIVGTGKKFGLICIMSSWSELLAPVKSEYVCMYELICVCIYQLLTSCALVE